jgi:DNA-binding LytR/AlgR family response regulator
MHISVDQMTAATTVAARGLRPAEIKAGLVVWALIIAAACSYCLMYQAFVSAVTPDLHRTIVLAMREWGAWLVFAPLAFRTLRSMDARGASWKLYALVGSLTAAAASLVPAIVDQIVRTRTLASSIAIFWPRYLAIALVVYLVWYRFLRGSSGVVAAARSPDPLGQAARPATLLVSKGADQCLIGVGDIQYLVAAGNYIEICARGQRYLLRATLTQLEEILPPGRFVRIHRSHIVEVGQIERISTQRSGSGTVHLRCGATLGMSRSYRPQLQQYRPQQP